MIKYPVVEVIWQDSSGWDGWHDMESGKEYSPISITSTGYLVKKTSKYINIVGSIDDQRNPKVDRQLCIPAKCIKSIRKL